MGRQSEREKGNHTYIPTMLHYSREKGPGQDVDLPFLVGTIELDAIQSRGAEKSESMTLC